MLMQASWIVEKDEEPEEIKMEGVDFMLIDVKDVRWVEFMEKKWEAQNEKQSTTS